MKHVLILLTIFLIQPTLIHSQDESKDLQYIEWTGEDEIANHLAHKGISHFMNIEREKAYTYFEAAVQEDPTLFAPHVVLSWMSKGDKKAYHKVQAQNLVKGHNEVSQIFASTLNIAAGKEGTPRWRAAWAKMHEIGHDGAFIHFQYALSLEDTKEAIAELEKLAAKNLTKERSVGHIHNILGYMHAEEGNKDAAKKHFEEYLALYPEGYNPYDSMAEFYLNEGDLENALTYYKKAKEKYPPATSATRNIAEIKDRMREGGNLVEVVIENVSPEDMAEYIEWGKQYKAIADKTNFKDFYVAMENGSFSYASVVGKNLADVDKADKEWGDWHKANPELEELYKKYSHTVKSSEKKLWKHSPKHSYLPEGYKSSDVETYARVYQGSIKYGHKKAVKELLEEFKTAWTEAGVSKPYNVYWNVYGEKGPCVAFRSAYKDINEWVAERKEVEEKVGQAKLNDLLTRWNEHMRKWEEIESFPQPDMTHIKTNPLAAND